MCDFSEIKMYELVVIHIKGYELVIIHRERVDMVQKYELVKIEYELVKVGYELVGKELEKVRVDLYPLVQSSLDCRANVEQFNSVIILFTHNCFNRNISEADPETLLTGGGAQLWSNIFNYKWNPL
jgi:hypothetical protein